MTVRCLSLNLFLQTDAGLFLKHVAPRLHPLESSCWRFSRRLWLTSTSTTNSCVSEAWRIPRPVRDTVYQFRSRCLYHSWPKSRLLGDESSCRGLDTMKSIRSVILPNVGKGSASERETDPRDGSMKRNISAGRCWCNDGTILFSIIVERNNRRCNCQAFPIRTRPNALQLAAYLLI